VTMPQELRAKLAADSRITCAVYVGSKPERDDVNDWISLRQVGGFDLEDLNGLEGTTKARMTVLSCSRSDDPANAQIIRDAAIKVLYGFVGVLGTITVTGITDAGSEYDYEEPKARIFCSSRDFYVWYAR
jgi:hypothetical protein